MPDDPAPSPSSPSPAAAAPLAPLAQLAPGIIEEFNVEAPRTRPPFRISAEPKIAIVMSMPRQCFTDPMWDLMEVVQRIDPAIKLRCSGAYWEKSISRKLKEAALAEPRVDYILALDYDSCFTPKDVEDLIAIMQRRPDLAALFPVQASRHEELPLVYLPELDYSGEITIAPFGHFGLTVLRADLFRHDSEHCVPQPWFMSVPNPLTNEWGEGPESDADISFWRNIGDLGLLAAQANRVNIGHLVLSVRWCSENQPGGIGLQSIENYTAKGKPPGVGLNEAAYQRYALERRARQRRAAEDAQQRARQAEAASGQSADEFYTPPDAAPDVPPGA